MVQEAIDQFWSKFHALLLSKMDYSWINFDEITSLDFF